MSNVRRIRNWLDHPNAGQRIMLMALLVRLIFLMLLANEPFVGDSAWYHVAAKQLLGMGELDTYWPPGLPLYEAAVGWFFGESEVWMRIAMLLWFFWLCRTFYNLAFRLHSRIAANVGLLILAFFPAFVHQSVEPLSYLPAAALLLALLSQLQAYFDQRKRGQLLKAGLLLGLLILFRSSNVLFLIALPPLLILRRRKLIPALMFTFFAAAMVGGWIWIASSHTGRFIPINEANARNFYLGNNAWTPPYQTWHFASHWVGDSGMPTGYKQQLDSIERLPISDQGATFRQAAWHDIRVRPLAFAERTFARARTLLAFDMYAGAHLIHSHHSAAKAGYAIVATDALFYITVGVLLLLFWFSEARRELSGSNLALLGGFLLVYALPYLLSFSHPTYHLPILPLMLLPAGIWVQRILEVDGHFPKWRKRKAWLAYLCLALFIAIQIEFAVQMNAKI